MIERDFNFELLPSVNALHGAAFGIGQDVSLDDDGFVPGSTDWAVQDGENAQNGATAFGRDRLLGPVWSWQLHTDMDDTAEALAAMRAFRSSWHALHIRDTPGEVLPLRFQLDGQRRRIYGRPRRFEAPPDNKILGGYIPISTDFKCVDGFVYDDVMREAVLRLGVDFASGDENVDSGGGFVFPLVFPHVTLQSTQRQDQLEIGGDAPAYPIVRFNGPVINPRLIANDWILGLDYTIPDGSYVEIDTRPWRMTALLNGWASVAGHLGRRQRLSKVRFEPGRFEAELVGSSTAFATCSIRWAPTYNSY